MREVLVDHGGFQAQAVGRVDVVVGVVSGSGRVHSRFVHGEVVQLARLSLVEEQCAVHLLREVASNDKYGGVCPHK